MGSLLDLLIFVLLFIFYLFIANLLSYKILKNKVLRSRSWGLNICCGKSDGGGINADVVKHKDLPNFMLIEDIYNLPFKDGQFENVLCSHTIEHVDDPVRFYNELQRVGKNVILVLPPLWDISASLMNIFEHKWVFLTFKKVHNKLPAFIPLPFAKRFQRRWGQKISA